MRSLLGSGAGEAATAVVGDSVKVVRQDSARRQRRVTFMLWNSSRLCERITLDHEFTEAARPVAYEGASTWPHVEKSGLWPRDQVTSQPPSVQVSEGG